MADADADTKLEQFFALEMALFFEHLNTAAQKYADTGELPNSLFGVKAQNRVTKPKRKDTGVKRPLSAYNIFVKEKYEEIKKSHPEGQAPPFKEIFTQVADMWKSLGDAQKQVYTAKAAAIAAAGEQAAAEAAAAPPVAVEPVEHNKKKKHKKEKHHKHKKDSSDESD